ncbi:hypothetical protein JE950_001689 [Flavobacterium psychrophilum]|nr:hypothetical protein [Flavobacterium psychrophilum]
MILFLQKLFALSDEKRKKIIEDLDYSEYYAEAGKKLIAIIYKLEGWFVINAFSLSLKKAYSKYVTI